MSKQHDIMGNPYGTENLSDLKAKMDKMNKQELIDFAHKVGLQAGIQDSVQELKIQIANAFKGDSRRINPMDAPRPKKFDLDWNDEKTRRLFGGF